MKPICVKCQRFYRPKTTGIAFIENYPLENPMCYPTPAGTSAPEMWYPYKLWLGDLWECQGCGSEIIVGVGIKPIAEHYQPDFAKRCKDEGAEIQVNDCWELVMLVRFNTEQDRWQMQVRVGRDNHLAWTNLVADNPNQSDEAIDEAAQRTETDVREWEIEE